MSRRSARSCVTAGRRGDPPPVTDTPNSATIPRERSMKQMRTSSGSELAEPYAIAETVIAATCPRRSPRGASTSTTHDSPAMEVRDLRATHALKGATRPPRGPLRLHPAHDAHSVGPDAGGPGWGARRPRRQDPRPNDGDVVNAQVAAGAMMATTSRDTNSVPTKRRPRSRRNIRRSTSARTVPPIMTKML